ncbi:MAG: tRNA uridine-5-carboxymethylaminomethyl(34) synthesis GTPase MnmE [Burkholderiaceae bacterium]
MLQRQLDPIAALATAPGRGAVGIVRLSGADLSVVIQALCARQLKPREAHYLAFRDACGAAIDRGLALHFVAPHSFTGEEVFELHAHGGSVVLQLLLARCLEAGAAIGLRLAEPGEFSMRAFLNGKIDLTQAEAIADLIDASTEAAARSAGRSLSGAFSAEIRVLLAALTELRVLVEATLDFPEEEVDILLSADVTGRLSAMLQTLEQIAQKARQGALLREGIKVVIAGQPNAGKSSLLNALAGAELALVSPIAGTTRDKIAQTIQIRGIPVHVVDTAGLRTSGDEVEQLGVARAWSEIDGADAVVFLHDLTRSPDVAASDASVDAPAYAEADAQIAASLAQRLAPTIPVIDVWNKVDAVSAARLCPGRSAIKLSARTGEGLELLRDRLLQVAGWQSSAEGVYMARERHLHALARVGAHIRQALSLASASAAPLDLLAEELRLGQNALAEITGAFGSDDLLGEIFSSFCIGK